MTGHVRVGVLRLADSAKHQLFIVQIFDDLPLDIRVSFPGRVENVRGVPYFMNIPFLGYIFRDTRYDNRITELMVLVTPRLVDPLAPGTELALPTDRGPFTFDDAVADATRDLLKMAVIERHRGTGNVGKGLVTGVGLKRGALASTVAHDHHNLVVIGAGVIGAEYATIFAALGIRVPDVEQSIGRKVDHTIVSDGRSVVTALNRGIPFVLSSPEALVSRDVRRLAGTLVGETATEVPTGRSVARPQQRRSILAWR